MHRSFLQETSTEAGQWHHRLRAHKLNRMVVDVT